MRGYGLAEFAGLCMCGQCIIVKVHRQDGLYPLFAFMRQLLLDWLLFTQISNRSSICCFVALCYSSSTKGSQARSPSVIVIGGGIAGLAAARALYDASFQVMKNENNVHLESIVLPKILNTEVSLSLSLSTVIILLCFLILCQSCPILNKREFAGL